MKATPAGRAAPSWSPTATPRVAGRAAIEQLPFALWESYARVFRFAPAVGRVIYLLRSVEVLTRV